jgi:DNA-binding MarR family transcriptional regulator
MGPKTKQTSGTALIRHLERITAFYAHVSEPIVGSKSLDRCRLSVLREACFGAGAEFSELRRQFRLDAYTLTRIAEWLVASDLAQVQPGPRDRRRRVLVARKDGREKIQQADKEIGERLMAELQGSSIPAQRLKQAEVLARDLNGCLQDWLI